MFKQTKKANQRQSAPFEIIAIVGAFDLSPNVPNLHFCTFSFFLQASTNISVFVKHVLFQKCAELIGYGFRRICFGL